MSALFMEGDEGDPHIELTTTPRYPIPIVLSLSSCARIMALISAASAMMESFVRIDSECGIEVEMVGHARKIQEEDIHPSSAWPCTERYPTSSG